MVKLPSRYVSRKLDAIHLASTVTTGTATEFPNCLYIWVRETGTLKSLMKPMMALHSFWESNREQV